MRGGKDVAEKHTLKRGLNYPFQGVRDLGFLGFSVILWEYMGITACHKYQPKNVACTISKVSVSLGHHKEPLGRIRVKTGGHRPTDHATSESVYPFVDPCRRCAEQGETHDSHPCNCRLPRKNEERAGGSEQIGKHQI